MCKPCEVISIACLCVSLDNGPTLLLLLPTALESFMAHTTALSEEVSSGVNVLLLCLSPPLLTRVDPSKVFANRYPSGRTLLDPRQRCEKGADETTGFEPSIQGSSDWRLKLRLTPGVLTRSKKDMRD